MLRFFRLFFVISVSTSIHLAAAELQGQGPSFPLVDQHQVLSTNTSKALKTLLVEHQRLTGDEIDVVLFSKEEMDQESSKEKDAEKSQNKSQDKSKDPKSWLRKVYLHWQIDSRSRGNGLLFALFPETQQAQIAVGYGLESVITPAISESILQESVLPELRNGQVDVAVLQGVYGLLEELNSPLVQSGEANELLRKKGVDPAILVESPSIGQSWVFGVVFGIVCLLTAFYFSTSLETYFTSDGWFKPRFLWQRETKIDLISPISTALFKLEAESSLKSTVYWSQRWIEFYPEVRAKNLLQSFGVARNPERACFLIYMNLRKPEKAQLVWNAVIAEKITEAQRMSLQGELQKMISSIQPLEKALGDSIQFLGQTLVQTFPSSSG